MKLFLSGNEAIARGAWEAGVKVATAYPGTPSTEILENLAKYEEIDASWSTNEKVAFEVALGAAISGVRSIVSMKHVGLNVAADPLFSSAYTGVNGGFVIVSCDDPGMHSSQNEQDNRRYAKAARIPLLEPSSPSEAYKFVKIAFEISEMFDIPILIRMTTRVSHTKEIVEVSERKEFVVKKYLKDPQKFVLLPSNARKRHVILEEKIEKIRGFSEKTDLNIIEKGSNKLGIVSSGASYLYAREVFPDATFFKIGMPFPFPRKKFEEFYKKVKEIYVIEENDPFIEEEIKILGYSNIKGKPLIPLTGELSPEVIRRSIEGKELEHLEEEEALLRPPLMCPGCPHIGVFYALARLKAIVIGDIGCYTLGALPPHNSMDTCICMGASIGNAFGFEKAWGEEFRKKTVAVIGDSTFFHSGIPPLIDMVYNKSKGTVIVLDNRTTAMTGHQGHPGTGIGAKGEKKKEIKIENVLKGIGVKEVKIIENPYNLKETLKIIKEAMERDELNVVVSRAPCALLPESREKWKNKEKRKVEIKNCIGEKCKACLRIGCPAIFFKNEKAFIDKLLCVGCDMCVQVCPTKAIV